MRPFLLGIMRMIMRVIVIMRMIMGIVVIMRMAVMILSPATCDH